MMRKLTLSIVAVLGAASLSTPVAPALTTFAATAPAPLHVAGNRLVDPLGRPVQLRGVNFPGAEYACIQGWGIFDGPSDQTSIDAMKSWNVNAVRLPLNEDCWLGINGSPESYSGATYQQAIASYVSLLTENGLYAILDLHWTAPGTDMATGQQPMPDLDHSPAFWSSVATAVKGNGAVILELFNEPHPDMAQDTIAGWLCWRDGGTCPGVSFQAAGMQTLVNAVRATGAGNVIALAGIQYGNALSQWLAHRPNDPLNNLVAAWHVYPFNACSSMECYQSTVGVVAAQMPVLATEIGNDACDAVFMNTLMSWLDAMQTGYFAWAWGIGATCADVGLITAFDGTPTPYGQIYKAHLAAFPPAIKEGTRTTVTSSATPSVFGQSITFTAAVAPVPPGAGTPSGTVTLLDGATSLGTATLSGGVASFNAGGLTVNSATIGHLISARYDGDAAFSESTSGALTHTVNKANTTATLAADGPNPSPFAHPVTLTATVAAVAPGAGTPAGSVAFFDGVSLLGTASVDAAGQASFITSDLPIGTHALTATYGGSASFEGSTSLPTSRAVDCPATLTMPFAIVGDEGRLVAVGTIRGTETTAGSRCAVAYTLDLHGLTFGGGTFLADHPSPGVITISNGTSAARGVTLPLRFAGTVNSNTGLAAIAFSFASGAPSRTVTIHYTLGPAGQWIITSTMVTKS